MICPNCGCHDSAGVTRTITQYSSIKRYRKCISCGTSYTTKEVPETEAKPKKISKSDVKPTLSVENTARTG